MYKSQLSANNSEEFKDVIGRFPNKFGNRLFYFLLAIVTISFLLGWFIKSPDVVLAEVIVTAKKPPLILVSKTQGKIKIKTPRDAQKICKGEYIAVIENTANEDHIKALKDSLNKFSFTSIPKFDEYTFALKYNLGEIQNLYFDFLKNIYELNQFYSDNKFDIEISSLNEQVNKIKSSISKRKEIINYKNRGIKISKEKSVIDSFLVDKGAIIVPEYEQSKKQLFRELDEKATQENEIIRDKLNIITSSKKAIGLTIEKKETLEKLTIDLLTKYQNLINSINDWENTFVFQAPFDGTFEYLRFVSNGDFIKQGEPIISILPSNNKIIGNAYMPIDGAGKVRINQSVVIKLDTYPYQEYGTLTGVIKSISAVPYKDLYLVNLDIPNGLKSNNNIELNFSKEMKGQAEIITEDKRLISRVFKKIKHAFDRKRNNEIIPKQEKPSE